jgi:hypothetical protein
MPSAAVEAGAVEREGRYTALAAHGGRRLPVFSGDPLSTEANSHPSA